MNSDLCFMVASRIAVMHLFIAGRDFSSALNTASIKNTALPIEFCEIFNFSYDLNNIPSYHETFIS